jgi:hypothetical protein
MEQNKARLENFSATFRSYQAASDLRRREAASECKNSKRSSDEDAKRRFGSALARERKARETALTAYRSAGERLGPFGNSLLLTLVTQISLDEGGNLSESEKVAIKAKHQKTLDTLASYAE